jgi:Flp pilus assembly pilin Flp
MKKLAKTSTLRQLAKDSRGAALFLILAVASVAMKSLGSKVTNALGSASAAFGS